MAGIIKFGVNYDKLKDFVNDKGYVNLTMFIDNDADQYNNNVTAVISQTKEQWENKVPKTYVGNGKVTKSDDGVLKAIEWQDNNALSGGEQSMAGRAAVDTSGTDGLPF